MDGSVPVQSSPNHLLPNYSSPIGFSRERNEELALEITRLSGHLNAATHRWLMLLAEFDDRHGWNDSATQSCAHWLNWKIGITMGAAREKVRVAHALQKLPKIAASMEKGELSYYKVRELTRVASPETEDALLMIAQHGSAHHVETVVRHFRRAKEAQELTREQEQQANRALSYHFDDENVLPRDFRASASHRMVTSVTGVPCGTPNVKSTHRMRRADALALMAESILRNQGQISRSVPHAMSGGDKLQIVVHVSAETLQHKECGQCEFEEGASIAAETARRLACDCSVVGLTEDEERNALNVGRKTRSIPPALSRALNSRDKGCHRLVHEGGWSVQVLDGGAFRFLKPNGEALNDSCGQSGSLSCPSLGASSSPTGDITLHPSRPAQWRGDKMDYGLAV